MPQGNAIKLRRGDAATWVSVNPVLDAGEPGWESDTGLYKTGNGTTAWVDLPYDPPSAHTHPTSAITGLDTALAGKAAASHTHATSDVTGLQTYVDGRISLVVDGAPLALDTLKELATALNNDANFAGTITTALAGKAPTTHTHTKAEITNFAHTHAMADLTDFTITSAVTGQIMTYNGTKWVNAAAPASGFNNFLLMGA